MACTNVLPTAVPGEEPRDVSNVQMQPAPTDSAKSIEAAAGILTVQPNYADLLPNLKTVAASEAGFYSTLCKGHMTFNSISSGKGEEPRDVSNVHMQPAATDSAKTCINQSYSECPNCEQQILTIDLEQGHMETCKLQQLQCTLHVFGCTYIAADKRALQIHMEKDAVYEHLILLKRAIHNEMSNIQEKIKTYVNGNREIRIKLVELINQLKEMKTKIDTRIEILHKLTASNAESILDYKSIEEQFTQIKTIQDYIRNQESRTLASEQNHGGESSSGNSYALKSEVQEAMRLQEHRIMLRLKELETTSFDGSFIWKVKGLKRHKNDDIQVKLNEIARSNLIPMKTIGRGGFSYICSATDTTRQKTVAVKELIISINDGSPEKAKKDLFSEARKMASIRDEHVLDIYGICIDPIQPLFAIVLPYMPNGSISSLNDKVKFVPLALRLRMLFEVASGMVTLHHVHNILHLDLKAANVLLTEDLHCKIADFGLSRWLNISASSSRNENGGSIQGTLSHIPPENLDPNRKPTTQFDVYSYGILTWEILTGRKTYEHCQNGDVLTSCVKDGGRPDLSHLPVDVPDHFKCIPDTVIPLMEKCWHQDPEQRGQMRDAMTTLQPIYVPHKTAVLDEVSKVLKEMV